MGFKHFFARTRFALALKCTLICLVLSTALTAHAESVIYLSHADQALMKTIELIKSAKSSIDMTYYIFRPCAISSRILLTSLRQKAAEGVKIRILIDSHTQDSETKKNLTASLAKSGVDIRYYNRMGSRPEINSRTHAKFIVADGQRYITGGRNLGDDYFGLLQSNFLDRDVYVDGESAIKVQSDFNWFWISDSLFFANGADARQVTDFENKCFVEDARVRDVRASIQSDSERTLSQHPTFQCKNVKFTLDDPKFWRYTVPNAESLHEVDRREAQLALKHTTNQVMNFLRATRESLVMENWAYMPGLHMDWLFKKLRGESVPITVVTNTETDVGGVVDVLNRHRSKQDNQGSQKIFGLSHRGSMNTAWSQTPKGATWTLHSKVFIANDRDVAITSFNVDQRSFHTNIESGVFIKDCPDLAAHVQSEVDKLIFVHQKDLRDCPECKVPATPIYKVVPALMIQEFL